MNDVISMNPQTNENTCEGTSVLTYSGSAQS